MARSHRRRELLWLLLFIVLAASLLWGYWVRYWARVPPTYSVAVAELPSRYQALLPLHEVIGEPQPGDWLLSHPEMGQSYDVWSRVDRIPHAPERRHIGIHPLGTFTSEQRQVLDQVAEYLGIYFQRPVRVHPDLQSDLIGAGDRRVHYGDPQIYAPTVLELLQDRLQDDELFAICLSTEDLYPDPSWNYVFGLATLQERVGVWSLYRYGNPAGTEEDRRLYVRRAIKVASHEAGHMFGIHHCIFHECNMCGSNNIDEMDRRPLHCCPICLAKIGDALELDQAGMSKRFTELSEFFQRVNMPDQADFFQRSREVWNSATP